MKTQFTDEMKKAIALATHKGDDFFILDGVAYEGDRNDVERAFEDWHQHAHGEGKTPETVEARFLEYVQAECCPLSEDLDDDYLVFTDKEADEQSQQYVADSLWAFRTSFICNFLGLSSSVEKELEQMQGELCEDANEIIGAMIGDRLEEFTQDAISADGRGHFLAAYDGNENEINLFGVTGENEYFYVYQIN